MSIVNQLQLGDLVSYRGQVMRVAFLANLCSECLRLSPIDGGPGTFDILESEIDDVERIPFNRDYLQTTTRIDGSGEEMPLFELTTHSRPEGTYTARFPSCKIEHFRYVDEFQKACRFIGWTNYANKFMVPPSPENKCPIVASFTYTAKREIQGHFSY